MDKMTYGSAAVHERLSSFFAPRRRRNGTRRQWLRRKPNRLVETKPPSTPARFGAGVATRAVEATTPTSTKLEDVTSPRPTQTTILVGDIGGTNARLTVWKIDEGEYTKIFEQWYPTKDYKETGFVGVLRDLCQVEDVQQNYPTSACFAIAGPVSQNRAKMTNLGWLIDGDQLQEQFNWKVSLVNDFEALGYGIPLLDPSDLVVLNDKPVEDKAPIAVLGPGTGLGEAQLMWDEGKGSYKVWPSEGAHSDFAPRTAKQRGLQEWIAAGYGYCELEHVACGAGLERIYTFLKSEGQIPVTDAPLLQAPEISKRALNEEEDSAVEALDMLLSIIGAEAGHMGLRCLAHGGIYIAGGITPKVIERVKTGVVLNAFLHEEEHRFRPLLQSFRLCAVLNEEVGLIGCRHQATKLLSS